MYFSFVRHVQSICEGREIQRDSDWCNGPVNRGEWRFKEEKYWILVEIDFESNFRSLRCRAITGIVKEDANVSL